MRRMEAVPHASLFYLPGGVIAALVLGMSLTPLREMTNAGNFVFAFVILIIVVGEMGGRAAAVATAACSALSLDFFLTKPYLSLRIEQKHDLIAFVGLTLCGLTAAALGSRRLRPPSVEPPDPRPRGSSRA